MHEDVKKERNMMSWKWIEFWGNYLCVTALLDSRTKKQTSEIGHNMEPLKCHCTQSCFLNVFYNVCHLKTVFKYSLSHLFQNESNGEAVANGSTIAADKKTD